MSGLEIIAWAVKQCEHQRIPPTDANIMMFIRQWRPQE